MTKRIAWVTRTSGWCGVEIRKSKCIALVMHNNHRFTKLKWYEHTHPGKYHKKTQRFTLCFTKEWNKNSTTQTNEQNENNETNIQLKKLRFFYKLQKKRDRKKAEQKNHLNTLNGSIRQTKRDRCHLFYINVNDWCMTLKCLTFLWKFWLLLLGLNERKKGLISCSVIIVCMFDLWFMQMLFVQLSIALFGSFFSCFQTVAFIPNGTEWILYVDILYMCAKGSVWKLERRKKNRIKNHQHEFLQCSVRLVWVLLFKIEKVTDLRAAKALPLKAFTRSQSTPEIKEKADWIFPFNWFCSYAHTHTLTYTGYQKGNLFNTRSVLFFD